jgi:outer membrane protein
MISLSRENAEASRVAKSQCGIKDRVKEQMGRFVIKIAFSACLMGFCSESFANDLLDVYLAAKEQDQQYQIALHQRDAAIEARPSAWAALFPQINASDQLVDQRLHVLSSEQSGAGSVNSQGSTSPGNSSTGSSSTGTSNNGTPSIAFSPTVDYYGANAYSVTLSQAIFDWSAFQTLAQSSSQVAEAEAALRSAQQSLITRCAQAYFNVLAARDTLRVDMETHDSYSEQLEQGKAKYQAGLVDVTDVRNAQASVDSSSASIIADRIALNAAVRALSVITGAPISRIADLRGNIPLEPPAPAVADTWAAAAAQNNPDLLTAYYAAEVAKKQISINRSKYLPTLNLAGSVGRSTSNSEFGDDAITDSIGLTVNWNIFAGGIVASGVRSANALFQQAQSQLELQRRTVGENTRNAFQQVVDGIDAIKANRLAVISNQASLIATKAGLKVGTRTETDVIVASQSLSAAEKAYAQGRYNYLVSVLALKQNAGYLADRDIVSVDSLFLPETTPALEPGIAQPIPGIFSEAEEPSSQAATRLDDSNADMMENRALPLAPAEIPPAENSENLQRSLSIVSSSPTSVEVKPVGRIGSTEPASCSATTVAWTVNGNRCSGEATEASNGKFLTIRNSSIGMTGQANVTCVNGAFSEIKQASCEALITRSVVSDTSAKSIPGKCPAFTLHGTFSNGESVIDGRPCIANFPPEAEGVIEQLTCTSPGIAPRTNLSSCQAGGIQGPVTYQK